MKNDHTPTLHRIFPSRTARAAAVLAAALLTAHLASAQEATNTWSGGGSDNKWSTSGNWTGALPSSANDTLFGQTGGSTTAGGYGITAPSNNVVDASQPINSLIFWNTNTFFNTYIGTGVTLTVGGTQAKALYVGNIFGASVLDEGKDATNYTTIFGGGTLVVTSNQTLNVRLGSPTAGSHRATLDLSGLSTLTANVSQLLVGGDGSGNAGRGRPTGTLMLAKTNLIVCSGGSAGANLDNIILGNSGGSTGSGTMYLGQTNAIFASYVLIGGPKCTAYLGFNTNAGVNLVNPTVLFRNNAGTGPMTYWGIGDRSTESGSTTGSGLCTVDFTGAGGYVDAQVISLYVGHGQTASGSAATGALTWTNGIINATTLMEIGDETATGAGATGTVNMGGAAQLIVGNGTAGSYLRLGNSVAGSSPLGKGVLNIGTPVLGGSVWVNGPVIEGGGNGDTVTVLGGSLKVSGPLGNTASVPPSAASLTFMTLSNATLTFDLGSTPNPAAAWWQVNQLTIASPGVSVTNNVLGNALTVGQFSLLQYGSLAQYDTSGFILGTLPPHVSGYLSNNTVNRSIDLVITNVSTPKWNGNVPGGAWDINTTANWLPVSGGGGSITYLQANVPGDSVLFDDSATGTTTVDLTTTLSPTSITVSNSLKNYTFTGSGSLSNSTGLSKSGSGTLTLSNTGTNAFTGPVAINGGTVQIAGGSNLLPTNAAVTLANDPTAVLDLNNNNQMLGSLAGGGASGGNVTLGTGMLTINNGGAIYNGVISGGGSVVKSGSGTEKFTTANLYSGGTLVSGGTLEIANTDGSGVGPGSVTVQTNGYFQIGDGGADGSIAVGTITNNGTVTLNRSDDLTFTTLLTGTGGFTKNAHNTVTITNANSYSGPTTIGSGTVLISDPGALGTGMTTIGTDASALLALPGGITLTQPVTVMQKGGGSTAPGIDNQNGTNILAGPISLVGGGTYWNIRSDSGDLIMQGASTVQSGLTGGRTLILSGNGNGEWWGNLSTSTANMSLSKADGGTWTLWGTNSYPGGTSVSAGQLNVNGVLTRTASVTVGTDQMGSGAVLSGNGLITGPVTNTGGGTLCGNGVLPSGVPSGAPLGRLTISNSLTLKSASTTIVGVSHSGCDQVVGLSQVTLGGTLQVVVTGTLAGGESFKLFDAAAYSGDFSSYNLPDLGTPLLSWDTNSVPVNGTLRVTGSAVPLVSGVTSTGAGNFQFSGTGPTNWTYTIVATTNLALPLSDWVQVSSGTFVNGTFTFSDPHAALYTNRFYRVVTIQ